MEHSYYMGIGYGAHEDMRVLWLLETSCMVGLKV